MGLIHKIEVRTHCPKVTMAEGDGGFRGRGRKQLIPAAAWVAPTVVFARRQQPCGLGMQVSILTCLCACHCRRSFPATTTTTSPPTLPRAAGPAASADRVRDTAGSRGEHIDSGSNHFKRAGGRISSVADFSSLTAAQVPAGPRLPGRPAPRRAPRPARRVPAGPGRVPAGRPWWRRVRRRTRWAGRV